MSVWMIIWVGKNWSSTGGVNAVGPEQVNQPKAPSAKAPVPALRSSSVFCNYRISGELANHTPPWPMALRQRLAWSKKPSGPSLAHASPARCEILASQIGSQPPSVSIMQPNRPMPQSIKPSRACSLKWKSCPVFPDNCLDWHQQSWHEKVILSGWN
jgi:hypothetical protein